MDRPTFQQAWLQTVAYRGIRDVVGGALAEHGINTSQWIILGLLDGRPGRLRVTDLARDLRVEDPLVTNLVRALTENELVKSTPHRRDKRARVLALTTKGHELVTKVEPALAAALAPIEACASPADWNTYYATLEKIVTATDSD